MKPKRILLFLFLLISFSCSKKPPIPERIQIDQETRLTISRENFDGHIIRTFEKRMSFSIFDSLGQNFRFVDSLIADSLNRQILIYLNSSNLTKWRISNQMISQAWKKAFHRSKTPEHTEDLKRPSDILKATYGYWQYANPTALMKNRGEYLDFPKGFQLEGDSLIVIKLTHQVPFWRAKILSLDLLLYHVNKQWPHTKFQVVHNNDDFEYLLESQLTDEKIRLRILENETTFLSFIFRTNHYSLYTNQPLAAFEKTSDHLQQSGNSIEDSISYSIQDSLVGLELNEVNSSYLLMGIGEQDSTLLNMLLHHFSNNEVLVYDIYTKLVELESFPTRLEESSAQSIRLFSHGMPDISWPDSISVKFLGEYRPIFGSQLLNTSIKNYDDNDLKQFLKDKSRLLLKTCLCREVYIVKHHTSREFLINHSRSLETL